MMQEVRGLMIVTLVLLAYAGFSVPTAGALPATVLVSTWADGQSVGEGAIVEGSGLNTKVLPGKSVSLSIVGGQLEGTALENTGSTLTAIEGQGPSTTASLQLPSPSVDSDSDGLSDEEEAARGTDQVIADSDGDRIQDGGEINIGTDPLFADTDGDGFIDGEEFDRAADPVDPNSFPVETAPNSIAISAFTCPAGHVGKDLFTDCTTPAAGVGFAVYIPGSEWGETKTTDGSGKVSFTGLGSGRFVVADDLRARGAPLQRYAMSCFGQPVSSNAPEPRQVVTEDLGNGEYAVDLASGEEIACTRFNIPAASGGESDVTAAPEMVSVLPITGTGGAADSGNRAANRTCHGPDPTPRLSPTSCRGAGTGSVLHAPVGKQRCGRWPCGCRTAAFPRRAWRSRHA